ELDALTWRETVDRRLRLGLQGDVPPGCRGVGHRIGLPDPDRACVGPQQAHQLGDEGRLACAVVSQEADDVTGPHLQGHLVVGHHAAERPRQTHHLKDYVGHRVLQSSTIGIGIPTVSAYYRYVNGLLCPDGTGTALSAGPAAGDP